MHTFAESDTRNSYYLHQCISDEGAVAAGIPTMSDVKAHQRCRE